jgi:hypothetical protein
VLALSADASRRRGLAEAAADPRRFGAGRPRIACSRCGEAALDEALGDGTPAAAGLVLADWGALARRPGAVAGFEHVVMVDPPPFEQLEGLAMAGSGYAHLAWGPPELELAQRCLDLEWQPRGAVEQVWRLLAKRGGEAAGSELRVLLAGAGHHPRPPEVAARAVAVLVELGLCEWTPDRASGSLRAVSSEQTELERSRAYGACTARHEEGKEFLRSRAQS